MTDILEKINILRRNLNNNPSFKTFEKIVSSMLYMSGRKNLLNLSKWTDLSYKKIERFFDKSLCWLSINLCFLSMIFKSDSELLLVGDETIVSKSGKETYGIDTFYSSLLKKPIRALCLSYLSLLDVKSSKSYPVYGKQLVFTQQEKDLIMKKKEIKKVCSKKGRGRPKGSKNKPVKDKPLPGTFRLLKEMLTDFFNISKFSIKYFVGDGYYGNNTCARICNDFKISLISKLQTNSALYYKYAKEKTSRGRPKKYGDKIDFTKLSDKYLKEVNTRDSLETSIYQICCLNKSFENELNVVIIVAKNLTNHKVSHNIFFSTDLTLSYQKIIEYYRLRFQIEFNFRDAKEFWGLEDFMNIKKDRIHNFINLSAFMVNLSQVIIEQNKTSYSTFSVRDLISISRHKFYTAQILKLIRVKQPNFLFDESDIKPYYYGSVNL